jgi:predicted Zn-dependent peptidase
MTFLSHKLDNGLQLLGESSPHALSLSVGFFVRTGSRDEEPQLSGVSHYLEHMAFKGNEKRTALEVNRDFDRIGSNPNAYTSEENTVYYASFLPEYLPEAMDLVANLLMPSLRPADFDVEKDVIINEIGKYHDQPLSSAFDQARQHYFGSHRLGNSILGSKESIRAMTYEQMRDYYRRRYVAPNVTVAVAGRFDWGQFIDLASHYCSAWPSTAAPRQHQQKADAPGDSKVIHREGVAREYVIMTAPAPDARSPLRHAADLLQVILGDGTGSRLYWELVDPGYADEATFYYHEYEDVGAFYTYFSCDGDRTAANRGIALKVLEEVQKEGVEADELEAARTKILSRVVRSGERPKGRMFDLGRSWTYYGAYRSIDDDLRDYEAVTLDHVRQVLQQFPLPHVTTLALGPVKELAGVPASPESPASGSGVTA